SGPPRVLLSFPTRRSSDLPMRVAISNGFSRGSGGGTMSCNESFEIALPPSFCSRRSRSTSFRPIMPAAPMTRICMHFSFFPSDREAAIDQVDRAGGEFGFVGSEINREQRDLLRRAETAHRLAIDEGLADLGLRLPAVLRKRRD